MFKAYSTMLEASLRHEIEVLSERLDVLRERISEEERAIERLQELHCKSDDKLHMLAKALGYRFVEGLRVEKASDAT